MRLLPLNLRISIHIAIAAVVLGAITGLVHPVAANAQAYVPGWEPTTCSAITATA